jgi:hypothetical protein
MYHIVVTIIRRAALAAGHTSVVIFRALMHMNGPIEYDKAADLNDRPKLFSVTFFVYLQRFGR